MEKPMAGNAAGAAKATQAKREIKARRLQAVVDCVRRAHVIPGVRLSREALEHQWVLEHPDEPIPNEKRWRDARRIALSPLKTVEDIAGEIGRIDRLLASVGNVSGLPITDLESAMRFVHTQLVRRRMDLESQLWHTELLIEVKDQRLRLQLAEALALAHEVWSGRTPLL